MNSKEKIILDEPRDRSEGLSVAFLGVNLLSREGKSQTGLNPQLLTASYSLRISC